MPVKFYNVKTNEEVTVNTEPHISAFFNSSNMGPNALVGQDFGWRLAPETIAEIRRIKKSPMLMNQIAAQFQLPMDGVADTDIVRWISAEEARKADAANETNESDYTRDYEDRIRALDATNRVKNDPNPSQPAGAPVEVPASDERTVEDVIRTNEERRANSQPKVEQEEDLSGIQDLLDDDEPEATPEPVAQPEKSKSQQRREATQSENKSK